MKIAAATLLLLLASLASSALAAQIRPNMRALLSELEGSTNALGKAGATVLYTGGICTVYADTNVQCGSGSAYTYAGCCTSADKYGYCDTVLSGNSRCNNVFKYTACCKYPDQDTSKCRKPRDVDSRNRNCDAYTGYTIDACARPGADTAYPQANPQEDCPDGTQWWCCPKA